MAVREVGIGPDGLKLGASIIVAYENPRDSPGSIHLNLMKDDDNYVLHYNPRWGQNKIVILNSKEDGKFGQEERIDGYNFQYGATVFVKFVAESDKFRIFIYNDTMDKSLADVMTTFSYRVPLTNTVIKKVKFKWEGASAGAEPISVHIEYK